MRTRILNYRGPRRTRPSVMLAGLIVTALIATACSSDDDTPGTSSAAPSTPQTSSSGPAPTGAATAPTEAPDTASGEVVFANPDFLQPVRGEALWAVIQDYTKANPKVTMKKVDPPFGQYTQVIDTQFGAGAGPDIFVGDVGAIAKYNKAGLLVPMDGVLPAGTLNSTQELAKVDGVLMGVPFQTVNYALIWNKKLVADAGITAAPTTFDELLAAAKQCKEKLGVTGFAGRSQMNEADGWWADYNNWIQGFGGGMSKDGKLTLNSPENIAAVTAFKQIYDSGAFSVGDDASTFRLKFGQSNVCYAIENSASANIATTNTAGHLEQDNLGVGPLPFPTGGYAVIPQMLLMNKQGKNVEAAKAFLKWFYEKPQQDRVAEIMAPATLGTDSKPSANYLTEHPWAQGYLDVAATAKGKSNVVIGFEAQTPQIQKIFLTELSKVLTANADPTAALNAAQSAAESAVG